MYKRARFFLNKLRRTVFAWGTGILSDVNFDPHTLRQVIRHEWESKVKPFKKTNVTIPPSSGQRKFAGSIAMLEDMAVTDVNNAAYTMESGTTFYQNTDCVIQKQACLNV